MKSKVASPRLYIHELIVVCQLSSSFPGSIQLVLDQLKKLSLLETPKPKPTVSKIAQCQSRLHQPDSCNHFTYVEILHNNSRTACQIDVYASG